MYMRLWCMKFRLLRVNKLCHLLEKDDNASTIYRKDSTIYISAPATIMPPLHVNRWTHQPHIRQLSDFVVQIEGFQRGR